MRWRNALKRTKLQDVRTMLLWQHPFRKKYYSLSLQIAVKRRTVTSSIPKLRWNLEENVT